MQSLLQVDESGSGIGPDQDFVLRHEPIADAGRAALVPWDTKTFGFPVAEFEPAEETPSRQHQGAIPPTLQAWLEKRRVRLCAAFSKANDTMRRRYLVEMGFIAVDITLAASRSLLCPLPVVPGAPCVRPYCPADRDSLICIAETSLEFGRYHADPLFPRDLAIRRNGDWVRRAIQQRGGNNQLLILGPTGEAWGFIQVTIQRERARLQLAAVRSGLQNAMVGPWLFQATLRHLREAGIHNVVATISAANTPVLNLYHFLGFHVSDPQWVFHWHAPALRTPPSP